MKAFVHVSPELIHQNDKDGGRRPVLVIEDERGRTYTATCIRGLNGELRTQQSHPDAHRPHAWIEVSDAALLDLVQDARLDDLRRSFTGQLQEG